MQIQSIELANFRCYAGAVIDLPTRVTFLVGRNHFGKSSVNDAVSWALLGRCRGTDARGVGSDSLIRNASGVSAMKVALKVTTDNPKPFVIERMQNARTSTLAIGGLTGNRNDGIATLTERFGVSQAVIGACLDSEAFLELHHADAKNLLLDVLDVRVRLEGDAEPVTLAELDQRYDHWYRERPVRKKALESIRVPEKPGDDPLPALADLQARLAAVREEEKALIAQTSQESGRRGEIDRQIRQEEETKARLEEKLQTLNVAKGLDGARVDLDDALIEIGERLAASALTEGERDRANEAQASLLSSDGRLKMLADTREAIENHAPSRGCVLNAEIECRTPSKAFASELKRVKDQITALEAELVSAKTTVAEAQQRQRAQQTLQTNETTLKAQARDRDAAREQLAKLNDSLTKLLFERDMTSAAEAGATPELEQLQRRIAKGEASVQALREETARRAAYALAHEQQKAAAKALAEAERNVDRYGPKGVRVQALGEALSGFQARINLALGRFGYALTFHLDPWLVIVNDRPAQLLSKSERLQVGIALQLALAEVSGFGFVAIDQVDLFDAENRRTFGALIDATPVQVLAAMTANDNFEPPPIADWSWVRIAHVDGVSAAVPIVQAVLA